MLVYKNDYVTIDAEKVDVYVQPMTEKQEDIEQEQYRNDWLLFHFTVQCNGKMKRSTIKVDVKKYVDCSNEWDVNWFNLSNYDQLYLHLQLLFDLWYDVPTEIKANKIAHKALELFN